MNVLLSHELARLSAQERQSEAAASVRANRLRAARRWQRRAEVASHRARLARLAIQ